MGMGVAVEVRETANSIETSGFPEFTLLTGVPVDKYYPLRDLTGDGFEYGFGGSGPGNLALAILANFLGESNATEKELYEGHLLCLALKFNFKETVIAKLNKDYTNYTIQGAYISQWFRESHPEIDLETYKRRRDDYRENRRLEADIDVALESGIYDEETNAAEVDAMLKKSRELFKEILNYEIWLQQIRQGQ
jgi:hypothetical protein